MKKCNYTGIGKITGVIIFKTPSKYMIKKYGYEAAVKKSIIRTGQKYKMK